jgi:hypothetical protein
MRRWERKEQRKAGSNDSPLLGCHLRVSARIFFVELLFSKVCSKLRCPYLISRALHANISAPRGYAQKTLASMPGGEPRAFLAQKHFECSAMRGNYLQFAPRFKWLLDKNLEKPL